MADVEKPQEIQTDEQKPKTQTQAQTQTNLAELKKSITVDTLHNDEALKVLANYTGEETWDEKEEKRVMRKIDSVYCPSFVRRMCRNKPTSHSLTHRRLGTPSPQIVGRQNPHCDASLTREKQQDQ